MITQQMSSTRSCKDIKSCRRSHLIMVTKDSPSDTRKKVKMEVGTSRLFLERLNYRSGSNLKQKNC